MRTWKSCKETLGVISPNMPKDIKVCISRLIIIGILHFLDSFYLHYMGWIKPKKTSHATVPLKGYSHSLILKKTSYSVYRH
jgi:hypothetical protein